MTPFSYKEGTGTRNTTRSQRFRLSGESQLREQHQEQRAGVLGGSDLRTAIVAMDLFGLLLGGRCRRQTPLTHRCRRAVEAGTWHESTYVSKYVTAERPARSGQARASRRTQTAPHTNGHAPQMPRFFPTARAQPISPCISASLGLQRIPAAPSGATLPPTAYLAASIALALS